MALKLTHGEVEFGIGDTVRVVQNIVEGNKKRLQAFEGMVIAIKGRGESRTFTVRRIGPAQIGIEKIFPLYAPVINKVDVIKEGTDGIRRAKLYYTRNISVKEVESIYQRRARKVRMSEAQAKSVKKAAKKAKKKPAAKKTGNI